MLNWLNPTAEMLEAKRVGYDQGLAEAKRKPTWAEWMEVIDEAYPLEIFGEGSDDNTGPRIVALCREIDRLKATLEKLPKWQSMDTAPRDGTELLLRVERRAGVTNKLLVGHYMPGGHCIDDHPPINEGWYFWTGNMFDKASKPTAWMSIEAAEAAKESTDDK